MRASTSARRFSPMRFAGALALGVVLALLFPGPAAHAADQVLAHEDGTQGGKQSSAGTGHAIGFEAPRGEQWIQAVRIWGARYGAGYDPAATHFEIAICDEALQPLEIFEAPYALFAAGRFAWVDVPLPRVMLAPARFRVVVAFDPTATRGVYVGWADTQETHSCYALPGTEPTPFDAHREWMIRAVLTKRPARDAVRVVLLTAAEGAKTGEKSLGGGAHRVELSRPPGTWWIEGVGAYGRRYGGGYDPTTTTWEATVLGARGKVLAKAAAPYALFPTDGFAWRESRFAEPPEAPRRLTAVVDFAPSRTKGIYLGHAAPARKPASFTGRVGEAARAFPDGEWMLRVRLVSEKPVATPPPQVKQPAAGAKAYLADLDAIARTVQQRFPALEKKGVDWKAVVARFRPEFEACPDDATHVLLATRLLATLRDSHTGVVDAKVEAHVPAFDGLYGAGLWIAEDRGRLVLRALMPGHALLGALRPGDLLVEVGGRPAHAVHEEVRLRLSQWYGWSSTAFLDARLSFQFFPFGEDRTLQATFLRPGGGPGSEPRSERLPVRLDRWGPSGRGLSRAAVSLPDGLAAEGLVVATRLDADLGYLRVLGGMDEPTQEAFFAALDTLDGVKGLLLDGRGMGGGSDHPAWAMAGRFFSERRALAHDPDLVPTGDAPFEGPVVFLQDERMISSAETFTWALVETGRAVAVGRTTGGATIIPQVFEPPSGLFRYRLGVHDRETSVKGVHPEGVGSPPDVYVPYAGPLFAVAGDPERAVGLDVLRRLVAGQPRDVIVDLYAGVLGVEPERVARAVDRFRALPVPEGTVLTSIADALVDALILEEIEVHEAQARSPEPDPEDAEDRWSRWALVAEALGRNDAAERARGARARPRSAQERDTAEPGRR